MSQELFVPVYGLTTIGGLLYYSIMLPELTKQELFIQVCGLITTVVLLYYSIMLSELTGQQSFVHACGLITVCYWAYIIGLWMYRHKYVDVLAKLKQK
jgi:hypothetical protein